MLTGATTTGRTGALAGSLSVVSLALAASYAAVLVVLLPNQVAGIDPSRKVENLALVTTVSFVVAIASQPLVGALSDRTRSRYGRRVPWMVGGALVSAAALFAMGGAGSLVLLGALWVVAQFALNAVDVASSAVVPDEVPPSRRGRVLAVVGAGGVLGGGAAVVLAGPRADQPGTVYLGLGLCVLLATAVFAVGARARPVSVPAPSTPASGTPSPDGPAQGGKPALRGGRTLPAVVRLVVAPWRTQAFTRTFVARFFFVFAYHLVFAYQLFILTDHVGLGTDEANRAIGALTVVGLLSVLVGITVTGWLSDRTGDRIPYLVGACGLLAVSFFVPLGSPTVAGMAVFAALRGLAFGAHLAASSALVTEVLPDGGASAGKDLGLYNMATNIPQAVAPAVAAVVIARFGGYPALFVTASVAAVVALVGALLVRRARGSGDPHPAAGLDHDARHGTAAAGEAEAAGRTDPVDA